MHEPTHDYAVNLEWSYGRIGQLSSPELETLIECATPPEFPHGIPGIWSPEHLFTAAVSSCLMTTFLSVADHSNLKFEKFTCRATGTLAKKEGKWMMTEVHLFPELTLSPGEKEERGLKVLEKAEKACLISQSIQSEIKMIPTILQLELY
ncbi:OsmC family protein [Algoriphagus mannitolivorans]|uniref:OsmC family protein n=1 Tax=Algoriphagus mannitolivorans TaxID=226504 RepID=UPI00041065C8|nr:OsmC family protein [Algoriphagus mannitolivorans]